MSFRSIQVYNTFLAILSLLALAVALGLVVHRLVKGKDAANFGVSGLWMAWTVAFVATVGSLIYSEVIGFIPCRLCWFQRIAMYPMAVVLLVGAIRKEVIARFYALPLALIGLGISIWHYIIQVFPQLEGGSCDPIAPCSSRYVEVFGFISIPFMAGAGFTLIAVLLLLNVKATSK
jgi:disulfide bond formation protein DsbB